MSDQVSMSREELREVVREAVHETLITMGVDPKNPVEMQRDFQHLREWRNTTGALKRHGLLVLLGIFVAGTVAAIWLGFQSMLNK